MQTSTYSRTKIWLSSPHMGENERHYVNQAFDENWIAPLGPHVDGFEHDLQNYTGAAYAAALSSGTAAIHLALILLGVGAGDEVICQSLTFCGTSNPVMYQGALPVFVDSETDTWNMSPVHLRAAIKDRLQHGKKPKAIIYVHLYGMPAQVDEIQAIAREYDIPLIEDAAEALGSVYYGRPCGTLGDMSVLSFNGNKIITTSGGGALLSNNKSWIEKARHLATQARDAAPHYQHAQVGYNYRMSNVCAAIGRGQIEVLGQRVAQRRANHDFYESWLGNWPGVSFLREPKGVLANRWLSCILIDPEEAGFTREDMRLALAADNIESRPLWKPMHLQPIYANCPFYGNGTSEFLFERGLCLPSGSNLTEEDRARIREVAERVNTNAVWI
jgi:dTDP-4-amino-4,6-dideoxygalactose transaminase